MGVDWPAHFTGGAAGELGFGRRRDRLPGRPGSPGVQHEAVHRAAGQRLRGSHPIQTVNQRHRQLQQFLLPFHGVATKCLGNHLRWHQEIGLASQPSAGLPARLPGTPMHTFRELSLPRIRKRISFRMSRNRSGCASDKNLAA